MITTVIIYIVFAIMDMFDAMLSGLGFIKTASSAFNIMIQFIDAIVFYVRSLLPLTISAIFTMMFQLFTVYIVIWFISWIMATIPLFGNRK